MIDFADIELVSSDGGHLTIDQVDAIESYVAKLLQALDLAHWRVFVGSDLPPEGARLSITPTNGRRIAGISVSSTWWSTSSSAEKRVDLTHEVLHLIHHDTDAGIRRFLDGSGDVSEYVQYLVLGEFNTNLERMVDSLSYVIAPFMPEWIDSGEAAL